MLHLDATRTMGPAARGGRWEQARLLWSGGTIACSHLPQSLQQTPDILSQTPLRHASGACQYLAAICRGLGTSGASNNLSATYIGDASGFAVCDILQDLSPLN